MAKAAEVEPLKRTLASNHFPDRAFQRLEIEYLAVLKMSGRSEIRDFLFSGLEKNLLKADADTQVIQHLLLQIEQESVGLSLQTSRLRKEEDHCCDLQKESVNKASIDSEKKTYQSAEVLHFQFANYWLLEAFHAGTHASPDYVNHASHKAKSVLQKLASMESTEYLVHFKLGWLYLFLLNQPEQAAVHFKKAATLAAQKSKLFEVFSLRHLACAEYRCEHYSEAVNVMLDVLNNTLYPDPEFQYEFARYLAMSGDAKTSSLYLAQSMDKLPLYFTRAEVESDFHGKDMIRRLLTHYKAHSIEYLRKQSRFVWNKSELARLQLPIDISPKYVFQQVCEQHEADIKQKAFVMLRHNEAQLGHDILSVSKRVLLKILMEQEKQYHQKILNKRKQWKWVNRIGGGMIHIASVLLLSVLFVLVARFLFDIFGLGYVLQFDEMTGAVFLMVLLLGIGGASLMRSQPYGMQKLFNKACSFREAVVLVQKL